MLWRSRRISCCAKSGIASATSDTIATIIGFMMPVLVWAIPKKKAA